MASSEEQKEQERIWQDVFNLFDKDRSKTICPNELHYVMRALNLDPTEKELKEAMDTLGKNGVITFEDFKDYMKKKKQSSLGERKQDMLNAFSLMDKNKDKHLDANELISVLTKLGEPLTAQEAEAMIRVADVNKDGKIDYEEFVDFLVAPYLQSSNERRVSRQSSTSSFNNQPPHRGNTTSTLSQESMGFDFSEGPNSSMRNYFRAGDSTDSNFSMRTQPEITDTSDDTFS